MLRRKPAAHSAVLAHHKHIETVGNRSSEARQSARASAPFLKQESCSDMRLEWDDRVQAEKKKTSTEMRKRVRVFLAFLLLASAAAIGTASAQTAAPEAPGSVREKIRQKINENLLVL